jgi:hypothetical protein
VREQFGKELWQLGVSKYEDRETFMEQFGELDDLERLLWCDQQLKEAYLEHTRREGLDTARKNIYWTLMVCREFKSNHSDTQSLSSDPTDS